jgi:membrane protease YdiL (CAAX protease family)
MKKTFFAIEFAIVALFLLLPPVIFSSDSQNVKITLTPFAFFSLAAGLFLYFFNRKPFYSSDSQDENINSIKKISVLTVCFGLLILTSVVFFAVQEFLLKQNSPETLVPENAVEWIMALTALAFGAVYEEALYRFFVPQFFLFYFEGKAIVFFEAVSVLLFALAHLYLGTAGFLNALICGIILRLTYKKTKDLPANCLIHFLYNSLLLTGAAVF